MTLIFLSRTYQNKEQRKRKTSATATKCLFLSVNNWVWLIFLQTTYCLQISLQVNKAVYNRKQQSIPLTSVSGSQDSGWVCSAGPEAPSSSSSVCDPSPGQGLSTTNLPLLPLVHDWDPWYIRVLMGTRKLCSASTNFNTLSSESQWIVLLVCYSKSRHANTD